MRTGIVLERTEKNAVILKSDGTFHTVKARKNWKIGDVVQIHEIQRLKSLPIAACIVFCLLIGISSQMYFTKAMVLSVDDKQSVEFNINRFGKIISVKGYNKESEDSLSKMNIRNKNYEDVLKDIVLVNAHNIEDESGYMLITIQMDNKNKEMEVRNKIDSITEISHKYNELFQIDYMIVDSETLKNAHSHEMTAGIYSKVQKLAEMDSNINIEDYSHCNINTINEEIKMCHEQSGTQGHHHGNSTH